MSFSANILNVMVASPGDVSAERDVITQELLKWNAAHATNRQLFLQPLKWETHSSPQLGAHPQHIINDQLLREADIVVGIFGTRIGTATPEFVSGTVEEIKRHAAAGKLVMLYFSVAPVDPNKLDLEQLKALRTFKEECKSAGLFWEYSSISDLESKFGHHLAIELSKPKYLWLKPPALTSTVEPELSEDEIRLLTAAASDSHGHILVGTTLGGYYVQTNNHNFVEDSARSEARWKRVIRSLDEFRYIEQENEELYRITEEGYQRADREAAKIPLQVTLNINGRTDNQTLGVTTNKPITIKRLDFLTNSEAFVAGTAVDVHVTSHEELPVIQKDLTQLSNANPGSGKLRVSLTISGKDKELILPVSLTQSFVNSTFYTALSGSQRFELSA